LEKRNLSCVDAYEYRELNLTAPLYVRDMEGIHDQGGSKYAERDGLAFVKVPLRNCEQVEYRTPTTADVIMDDFCTRRISKQSSVGCHDELQVEESGETRHQL